MPDNDRHRIEDIKRHLYDVDEKALARPHEGKLHSVEHAVLKEWPEQPEQPGSIGEAYMKKSPTSIFKKFFFVAIGFLMLAIAFSLYTFFTGGAEVTNEKIDITVLGNAFTKGGDELPLQVEITNRNGAALELANLIISYPSGASDNPIDVVRLPRDPIGTIGAGQTVTRNVKVKLYGDEKSTRDISIDLEYHPQGSNAIFTREKLYTVTISSAPLSLSIDSPSEIARDQTMTFTVTATLNTTLPEGQAGIVVAYPPSFVFEGAVPSPKIGNSVWSLESLDLQKPVLITIKGRMVGQEGDEQVVHVYAGALNPSDMSKVKVVYNSLLHPINIIRPFLETHILVNNQDVPEPTLSSDEKANVEISWVNNLPNRVTDAVIIANLSGNVFDRNTIISLEGFYDSANNQVIWDKNSIPELASVEPGEHGTVGFSFKTIPLVGSSGGVRNPQIVIDVSIKGREPSLGTTYSDVNNFSKKVIKIVSDLQIASGAVFASGSLPPKAENQTTYTITWTLSNSANSIASAQAKSTLPLYVSWGGAQAGENVSYNEVTREVVWNIGNVSPNTGFISNREASFNVILKPSLSQVDSIPQLMKEVYVTGTDTFTNTMVKASYRSITTLLSNDPSFQAGYERVIK